MLDRDVIFLGRPNDIENLALKDGSSQQGKALLALIGENCVVASHL